jgi:hypothetical protein
MDGPGRLKIGQVSLLGAMTMAITGMGLTVWLVRPVLLRSTLSAIGFLVALWGWSVVQLGWCPIEMSGWQQLAMLPFFFVLTIVAARAAYQSDITKALQRITTIVAVIACGGYLGGVLVEGLQSGLYFGPRPFALFSVILLPWFMMRAKYGEKRAYFWIALIILAVLVSLSRTAFFACLLMFPLTYVASLNRKRFLQLLLVTAVGCFIGYEVMTQFPAFQRRMTRGDRAFRVGDITVNSMGRTRLWAATWDSFLTHPILGQGVGQSRVYLVARRMVPHPHNDYLRVLDENGLIGFILFVGALTVLSRRLFRQWRDAEKARSPSKLLHGAAFCALVGYMITMATDNPMVYAYFQGALACFIGASLGAAERDKQRAHAWYYPWPQ